MKRILLTLVFLFAASVCYAQTVSTNVTITDPNTGAKAVDGVDLYRSDDGGATKAQVTTLKPGQLTFSEILPWVSSRCYYAVPFNTAGRGPESSDCQIMVKQIPDSVTIHFSQTETTASTKKPATKAATKAKAK